MTRRRNLCSMAAIGGPIAALSLLAGSPASKADELADLRANQELLPVQKLRPSPEGRRFVSRGHDTEPRVPIKCG